MTDIQAALGISQLEKLGSFVKKRQEIVNKYIEFLIVKKILLELRRVQHPQHLGDY